MSYQKTKEEKFPDLAAIQEASLAAARAEQKEIYRQAKNKEKADQREREELAKLRSYDTIMKTQKMKSNAEMASSVDTR